MKQMKEFKVFGKNVMLTWRDGRKIREGSERQICHRITCKGYKRKCVNGGNEMFKEQYSPANIDI